MITYNIWARNFFQAKRKYNKYIDVKYGKMRKHTLKDIHTYTLKYYINMWVWIYSISTSTVWVQTHTYILVHGRESKKDFTSLLDGKKYD